MKITMNKSEENKTVRIRVAGILCEKEKILLVSHKKKDNIYWLLPGGGVDYGESLDEALKREFSEELNIDIDVHDLILVNDSRAWRRETYPQYDLQGQ